jgi:hypothetical protein
MAMVFLAGPLSGLIVQPLVGQFPFRLCDVKKYSRLQSGSFRGEDLFDAFNNVY